MRLLSFFPFFQQVVFLTVNHHGPLPLRELHSTDETIVWRDPGGSWVCLRPVYSYEWINSPSQSLWHRHSVVFVQQVVFLTVNHRGPLPLRELHSTDETLAWRDPGGSWACLQPVPNYKWINSPCQRLWHRHNASSFFLSFFSFFQQVVFLTVNHHRPLPLRELHSTDETIVWRDPGGSWACLRPVYNYEWINSPSQRLCDTDIMRLLLSFFFFFFFFLFQQVIFLTVNHCGPPPPPPWGNFTDETIVWRDPGGSWACLRPVSNYKWINWPYQRLWHRPNLCRFVVVFAGGRFSYGESLQTPPLEGTSLHRWSNSVERPWGILSLLTTCCQIQVDSPCLK